MKCACVNVVNVTLLSSLVQKAIQMVKGVCSALRPLALQKSNSCFHIGHAHWVRK